MYVITVTQLREPEHYWDRVFGSVCIHIIKAEAQTRMAETTGYPLLLLHLKFTHIWCPNWPVYNRMQLDNARREKR